MCDTCRRREDADRLMWQAIRRGLLAVVKAIEVRYADRDGATLDDALADCREMLLADKAWYCDGPCAHIEMPPSVAKRRAAFRSVFRPEGK